MYDRSLFTPKFRHVATVASFGYSGGLLWGWVGLNFQVLHGIKVQEDAMLSVMLHTQPSNLRRFNPLSFYVLPNFPYPTQYLHNQIRLPVWETRHRSKLG